MKPKTADSAQRNENVANCGVQEANSLVLVAELVHFGRERIRLLLDTDIDIAGQKKALDSCSLCIS